MNPKETKEKRKVERMLTRIFCPIQEYDACRFRAQTTAKVIQQSSTTSERIETSPNTGKSRVFFPQLWPFLLNKL